MGQATDNTNHILQDSHPFGMWARLFVRDRSGNHHYNNFINREPTEAHVEQVLMGDLSARFGHNFGNIPDGSTIIFICNFSPCKECTANLIPGFVALFAHRDIIIKFKFNTYYSFQSMPGYKDKSNPIIWERDDEAQLAYNTLSNDFGIAHQKTLPFYYPHDGEPQVKHSFKLVISKVGTKGSYKTKFEHRG